MSPFAVSSEKIGRRVIFLQVWGKMITEDGLHVLLCVRVLILL